MQWRSELSCSYSIQRPRLAVPTCRGKAAASGAAASSQGGSAVAANIAGVTQVASTKTYDVVHLGNLCLDIIVPQDELPPSDTGVFQISNAHA